MKKFLLPILLAGSFMKGQTWAPIFTPGTPTGTTTISQTSLNDFSFYNNNLGIVSLGYVYHLTTDGGATWSHWKDFFPYPQNKAVFYLNATDIVTGTGNGRIYKSTDNGNTFTQKATPVSDVMALDFKGNFGVLVDNYCKASYSSDGGENWTVISNTVLCGNLSAMKHVNVVDANTTYICGNNTNFFKTTNGCVNWSPVITGYTGNYTGLNFIDANTGFVTIYSGSPNAARLLKTTDGGSTWSNLTPALVAAGSNTTSTFGAVYAIDANTIYVGVDGGKIMVSTDGGATFTTDFTHTSCTSCPFSKLKYAGGVLFASHSSGGTTSKVFKKTISGVGINEVAKELIFSIYPNPAQDFLMIEHNTKESGKVKIYSTDGKLVKEADLNTEKINISFLNAGIYIVKTETESGSFGYRKFVKE